MGERRIELRAELDAIRALDAEVAAFADENALPPGVAGQLCLVLEELLANLVRHGIDGVPPPEPPGYHHAVVSLARCGNTVMAVFEDSGRPFDPLALPEPDLSADLEDRPVGGLGIHLMRALMDSVAYARAAGHNRLTLVKTVD